MYTLNTNAEYLVQLKNHNYISPSISIDFYTEPFHYIVIHNLFKEEIYNKLCEQFPIFIKRTTPYKDQPGAVHDYAGYIYGLNRQDCNHIGYNFFIDNEWKNFCAQTFNIELNNYIALSAHWHQAPSKYGFVHRDLNICSGTICENINEVKLTGDCYYSDDSVDQQPNTNKFIRGLAGLFYLNNKASWTPEDKGGTSIYSGWDTNSFIREIPPENNSLFIFEVCPDSFHGYSGANFDRSAIVHWFHSSPAYLLNRHLDRVKFYHKKYNAAYERWNRQNNPWPIENDPKYTTYFDKPFHEILSQ